MAIENNGHDMGFLKKFMMENAGAAAVKRLVERFGDVSSKKILVYAGLGNNGGDAMVVARHLATCFNSKRSQYGKGCSSSSWNTLTEYKTICKCSKRFTDLLAVIYGVFCLINSQA